MNSHRILLGPLACVAVIAVACAEPPTESIDAARAAEQAAAAAGVDEYAPQAFDAVEEARVEMEAELAVQASRSALSRSYDRTRELAEAYRMAGEQATTAAAAAREEARTFATTLTAESRTILEEVRGMLAVAPVGKGSGADLVALRADLDSAATTLESAETALLEERYLEAEAIATSASEMIERVKLAIGQARGLGTT